MARFEHAEASVFVDIARSQDRLLTDDTISTDVVLLTNRIGDCPVTRSELRRDPTAILDTDRIRKNKASNLLIGLCNKKNRMYRHSEPVRFLIEERSLWH
jgi:hypothetical protein